MMSADGTIELRSGRRMPLIGLGTWQLTKDTADMVADALDVGYRMIDTSGDYGTQLGIGEGLRRSGIKRADVFVVTKVEETDNAYEATRKNLNELGLEYADLVLVHRPPPTGPGETLWDGLIRAKKDGFAKDIGVSNYAAEQIDELIAITGETPVVNQIEWSPFGHSVDMFNYCQARGIVIQAYSPLTRAKRLDDPTVTDIANAHHKTPAQILLRWNAQLRVVPLPKANRREHLQENIDIFDFEISDDDMDTLNGLNEHYSALGSLPYV